MEVAIKYLLAKQYILVFRNIGIWVFVFCILPPYFSACRQIFTKVCKTFEALDSKHLRSWLKLLEEKVRPPHIYWNSRPKPILIKIWDISSSSHFWQTGATKVDSYSDELLVVLHLLPVKPMSSYTLTINQFRIVWIF